MNYEFNVNLNEEDYINYLTYQLQQRKEYRGFRMWLVLGVPAVLVTLLFLFNLNSHFSWSILCAAVVILWFFAGYRWVWKRILRGTVRKKIIKKINVQSYEKVTYKFSEGCIGITQKGQGKKFRVLYSDIKSMVPFNDMFVFYHGESAFLLPYRSFETEEQLKLFMGDFEKKWSEGKGN